MTQAITKFNKPDDLKVFVHKNYSAQLKNFFSDEKQAMKFMSSMMSDVQKNPKLLECTPMTIVNSYMTMAQLGLMPSGVSGEAYVLPYKKGQVMEAQFQLGYQGLVTLFYRAGVQAIYADIVRENDEIDLVNGQIKHKVNPLLSMEKRGKAMGAYVVVNFKGNPMGKYMHADDVLAHGKKFSKSFGGDFSPWNEKNDPELWMWKKTVLKQAAKLLPKNETINKAIAADNQDSVISDRTDKALKDREKLTMGNLITNNNGEENHNEEDQDTTYDTEGSQE